MITKRNSTHLVRPLAIVALAMMLLLEGLPTASASAAGIDASKSASSYSSQVTNPPELANITTGAAGMSHTMMLSQATTNSSLSESISGQIDIAGGRLRDGRDRRHGRK